MLRGVQRNNPDLFGVGAMWEPNAYDGKDADYRSAPGCDASGRYLPYFATGAEISDQGDQLTSAYYTVPKSTHKTYIAHPQPYTINGKSVPMSTVVYPVMVNGSFRGTVLVDISLARFTQDYYRHQGLHDGLCRFAERPGKNHGPPQKRLA